MRNGRTREKGRRLRVDERTLRSSMMKYPLTLNALLGRAEKLFDSVEIVSRLPDRSLDRVTYGDFCRRAKALAEALQAFGLRRGDRVATLMWNHSAHLEAYFGVPLAGGVLHTLNLRLAAADLVYIIQHAGDRYLIVDDILLPLFEKVADQVSLEQVFVVPWTGQPLPARYESYEDLLDKASGRFSYLDLDEDEALGMCYTSGTTGKPKGVVYSHRAVVLHSLAECLPDALDVSQRDVLMPVVPMFHANAWGLPFSGAMVGCKLVFPGPYLDEESLLDLFDSEGVTLTAGVPTVWLEVLKALEANPDRWRLTAGMRLIVGGSAVPESLLRDFDRHGLEVIQAWGMTETTPLGTVSRLKRHMLDLPEEEQYRYRARQGLPVPLVETRSVNEAGEVPWDDQTMGELQVRGPWVASSYYRQEEAQDQWTKAGWFRTGDVVTIDGEGCVKITDRTKDLIKSGGEWVSSVDLENALMGHPAVAEAAVIGVFHPKWMERPLAVVVLNTGWQASAEELRQFLARRFVKWWLPDGFVFTENLPRTSTGKFLKSELRKRFQDYKFSSQKD
ncbi:MAG: long-chain fatty acid--CoA ligase [Acidobacteriota bacterium]